jgi:alkylhydroperoxidase/carboxymuconolactone decarboxylase family protein YurZ
VGGTIPGKDFLALVKQAGFHEAEMVSETGFNSSPRTRGVLIRAVKPAVSTSERRADSMFALGKYQEFFEAAYAEGALDRKTKHLIALGASLAAGCDP